LPKKKAIGRVGEISKINGEQKFPEELFKDKPTTLTKYPHQSSTRINALEVRPSKGTRKETP
jgi:hypothetical protein